GPDAAFDTADDALYTLSVTPAYVNGLSANYLVTDGPLQPGNYRFTVKATGAARITDRAGNPLAAAFVRTFTMVAVSPFLVENRSNATSAPATSLSPTPNATCGGSFAAVGGPATAANPYAVATADVNADGKLDLVTANYGANSVSVFLGNGDGTFAA